jgi:hypothetical protein
MLESGGGPNLLCNEKQMSGRTSKALIASKYWVALYVATGVGIVIIGIADGSVSLVVFGIVGGLAGVAMQIVFPRGNGDIRKGRAATASARPGVKKVGDYNERP